MLRELTLCLLALMLLWPAAYAQAPATQPKQAKDQQEFDLYNSIVKETDAKKKVALLDQWKQKYPDTVFKEERLTFYLDAYRLTGQYTKAVEAAHELLAISPNNFSANLMIATLTPYLGSVDPKLASDPKVWADGERAANAILQTADQQFTPDKKPPNVSDADWQQGKKQALMVAHQTLGWVANRQKKYDVAEQEFLKTLELEPTASQASLWLGEAVLAQKNPDKYTLALFAFARAAAYDGPGALTPQGRQSVDTYLTKYYKTYHGDESGLAELKALAKNQPLPPPDFKIKSSTEIQAEKEEELRKTNPKLAYWMSMKEGLESGKMWDDLKGKAMPALRGTVVSAKPAVKPKVVEIGISQSHTTEITLTAPETPARCKLDPGATIDFEGAEAKDFTPKPFMLKIEGGKITSGCTEAPAAVKKAPAKKAGAATKKKTSK